MAKEKNPLAAIKRATERAESLSAEDRATVIRRIETGKPEMGLVAMAYVEEVASGLAKDDRDFLVKKLKAIAVAAPAAAQ